MILLDRTYFQGDLTLPSVSQSEREGLGAAMQMIGENDLNYFLARYEPECLKKILGETLYKAFIAGLTEEPLINKWSDLFDALFRHEGLFSFSPVANYVYYYVMRDHRSKTTQKGEVIEDASFSTNRNNEFKMINLWNDMCRQVLEFRKNFLLPKWNLYKDDAGTLDVREIQIFEPINALDV